MDWAYQFNFWNLILLWPNSANSLKNVAMQDLTPSLHISIFFRILIFLISSLSDNSRKVACVSSSLSKAIAEHSEAVGVNFNSISITFSRSLWYSFSPSSSSFSNNTILHFFSYLSWEIKPITSLISSLEPLRSMSSIQIKVLLKDRNDRDSIVEVKFFIKGILEKNLMFFARMI